MARWFKIVLKITGVFLAVVFIGWMAIAAYVQTHKEQLLDAITLQLNENLSGTLTIGKMEPALIRGFPGISVSLKNILLRDSLWKNHQHDVLNAKDAYVSVDAFSILSGNPTIKNITITKGNIYFYTDSLGYSNTDIFRNKSRNKQEKDSSRKRINRIDLRDVNLVYDNHLKAKYFDFNISRFSGKIKYNAKGWEATANLNTIVKSLAFNTRRGSFLKNKSFSADLQLIFDDKKELLTIPMQDIKIGDNDFEVAGKFNLSDSSAAFALDIKTSRITLSETKSLLAPNIQSRLKFYKLENALAVGAIIRGQLKRGADPRIIANWQTEDNTLVANGETITNCSFNGTYTNEVVNNSGTTDKNSAISLYGMTGRWHDIPFKADSITITDLKKPVIAGKFLANFPLEKLNPVFGKETFVFNNGTASLNLIYKAPYFSKDESQRYINGDIVIKNASMTYLPRDLPFKNVQARLSFQGQDLYLKNINLQSGGSSLQMDGSIRKFLNLFYTDPAKMLLDWNIASPQVNLSQFLSFLGRRKSTASSGNMNLFSKRLDRTLNEASVQMQMKLDKVIYKKFIARNVRSNLTLNQKGISMNNVSLNHAGGSLQMNGTMDQTGSVNKILLNTSIRKANIQDLFYAFSNFGQTGITDENLRGTFDADCNVWGSLRDNGEMVPMSMRGTIDFTLRNGALVKFEPMEKIGSFAFKNRDFSNITLKSVSNRFTLQGDRVVIPPMQIQSSVLNIFLEGVYGFSTGTNIAMQVPLRNPKKDEFIYDEAERQQRAKKGIVLNLHATDGDDGKVKIKLGKD